MLSSRQCCGGHGLASTRNLSSSKCASSRLWLVRINLYYFRKTMIKGINVKQTSISKHLPPQTQTGDTLTGKPVSPSPGENSRWKHITLCTAGYIHFLLKIMFIQASIFFAYFLVNLHFTTAFVASFILCTVLHLYLLPVFTCVTTLFLIKFNFSDGVPDDWHDLFQSSLWSRWCYEHKWCPLHMYIKHDIPKCICCDKCKLDNSLV